MILINMDIVFLVLDLMHVHNFYYLTVAGAENVIIFGVDNSSSVHNDNKKKNILVLDKGPTQGLDDTTIKTEAKYLINFTKSGEKIVLSLHYNGSNIFYLLMH